MNVFKFNGVKVRYWYTDHQLCFMANAAFRSFGYKGWWNYMQRHPEDFFQLQLPAETSQYDYTWAISWDNLKKYRDNVLSVGGKTRNWWIRHHGLYDGFIRYVEENVLHKKANAKPQAQVAQLAAKPQAQPIDLTCPEHTHPATVAALRSLPKAKLPPADVQDAAPFAAPVQSNNISGAVYTPTLDDFAKSPIQQLFSKVTATLNRHKGGEDSFPRIRDYWNESTEEAVALKMALLKIARIENGISVEDSYVDAIGYLALAYNKYKEHQNEKEQPHRSYHH